MREEEGKRKKLIVISNNYINYNDKSTTLSNLIEITSANQISGIFPY